MDGRIEEACPVGIALTDLTKYGQLIKKYRNATMQYTPSEMVSSDRRGIMNIREDEERSICTSLVERYNLTIRTFMKRFTRLALGFSKKLECLEAAVSMFLACYNFVWDPPQGRQRQERDAQADGSYDGWSGHPALGF